MSEAVERVFNAAIMLVGVSVVVGVVLSAFDAVHAL